MDSQLGWDCSLWSNQQNGIEESFMVRHEDHVLISPIQEANSNSQRPISTAQIVLHQQLAASNWRDDDFADRLCLINCSMGDFGMANHAVDVPKTTTSLESLECLLSAGNSNGDTVSLEDDGISMIFSENLWSFGASRNVVSSSSGHDDHGKATNKEAQYGLHQESLSSDKNLVYHHHDHDEVVLTTKPNSSKRSRACASSEDPPRQKKARTMEKCRSSTTINFQQASSSASSSMVDQELDPEAIAQMKEMIYRAAAFRPVNLGMEVAERPKRKNVKISSDPQTVAARQRRERISERIRVLQKLVPGGTKMDTASMLDEAANYLKFLRSQVKALENLGHKLNNHASLFLNNNSLLPMQPFSPLVQNPIHHFT